MCSIPDADIFEKRFKNSCRKLLLTLPAIRCMMPSPVVKKIPKSEQYARRRVKNKIPMLYVANVINVFKIMFRGVRQGTGFGAFVFNYVVKRWVQKMWFLVVCF